MKRLLITLFMLLIVATVFGVPAAPWQIEFVQEDGAELSIFNRGDERLNWCETLDGYTLLNSGKNKVYAVVDEDGDLEPGKVIAHNQDERSAEEILFLNKHTKELRYSETQSNLASQIRNTRMGGFPTTGVNNMILILANFSDTNQSYTQNSFNNFMNQANYSGTGSFKDYYLEVSYGQLTVNTTVVGWVDVPNNHDYYGPQDKWAEFARDAIQAADELLDFNDFDNNNDGEVDGIAVIHQGSGQETTGDTSDIWSHNFNLHSAGIYITVDGISVSNYTLQPEKQYYSMVGIGVICHEFGHNLGTPDFYDTNYATGGQQPGTGEWDVMGSGAYNGNGDRPAHHNMWTKELYTWVEPQELTYDGGFSLNSSMTNQEAYYFTTPTTNEVYLLENVQQTGFNYSVPGHGLIVYHVDGNWISSHLNNNSINTTSHQGMYIVPSNNSLNSGNAPFPSPGHTSFTDDTNPGCSVWSGADTDKGITNIIEQGGVITFDYFDNSAYLPEVEFDDLMNNQYFNVGDDINLSVEVASTIYDITFVEFIVNGQSQTIVMAPPYDFSFTATESHVGAISVEAIAYVGDTQFSKEYTLNIGETSPIFLEQFESYADFSTSFDNWESIDIDNMNTIDMVDITFPNETSEKAFMIFNPNSTVPPMTDFSAFSGDKVAASFSWLDAIETAQNNDWLISSSISIPEDSSTYAVQLAVKGTEADGELFNVLYSNDSIDPDEFTSLTDTPIEATEEWNSTHSWDITSLAGQTIRVAVQSVSTAGQFVMVDDVRVIETTPTSNQDSNVEIAAVSELSNFPNPFNPETTIKFNLGAKSNVKIDIYNMKGQKVNTLVNESMNSGDHHIVWKGDDSSGQKVSSGIYFYRVKTAHSDLLNKMILMK